MAGKIALLIFSSLFALQVFPDEPVLLRVREHVTTTVSRPIKLVDIVESDVSSEEISGRLNSIQVSGARWVAGHESWNREKAARNLGPALGKLRREFPHVEVFLPESMEIQILPREMKAKWVVAELISAWQIQCTECRLNIESLSLPAIEGITNWEIKSKLPLPKGSFSIPILLTLESGKTQAAWISGQLRIEKQVPVATRAISIGARISKEDFVREYRDVTFASDGIPTDMDLIGRQMRQGVSAGGVLWLNQIAKEKAVTRGEVVKVKAAEDDWEVSLALKAQQDAYIGDSIQLRHPTTNHTVSGVVVAPGEVELR